MSSSLMSGGYPPLISSPNSPGPGPQNSLFSIERDVSSPLKSLLFYNSFESQYHGIPILRFSISHRYFGFVACLLYLSLLPLGLRWMKNRKPFDLRRPLKYWNLFLALFSFIGATRTVPHLLALLYNFGWRTTMCSPSVFTYGSGSVGLWTMLFIYSKYVELIDTAFIVLRKKPLSFLHWYHHATVLLYTWDAFVTAQPPGLYFIAMNYTVHAIMYFYYFLAAALAKPPKWGAIVTVLQISQMICGIVVTTVGARLSFSYPAATVETLTFEVASDPLGHGVCDLSRTNVLSAVGMYSTYFYLFAEFFVGRYFLKSDEKGFKSAKKAR